jgi:ssRNA-specific RNase YbeY (16S rRNA maturation enzyme)
LHLLGYDHKDTKTTKEMQKKEKEILKGLGA